MHVLETICGERHKTKDTTRGDELPYVCTGCVPRTPSETRRLQPVDKDGEFKDVKHYDVYMGIELRANGASDAEPPVAQYVGLEEGED